VWCVCVMFVSVRVCVCVCEGVWVVCVLCRLCVGMCGVLMCG
jgi:hypothetical protein